MSDSLFSPLTFERSGRVVENRLVVAAMTNQQSHADGRLHDRELRWLVRRAEGGFGIVTTCAAHVRPDGQGWPGELGAYDDLLLPGLRTLAEGLRTAGSLGLVQLFHGGLRSPAALIGQQPWSASSFSPDRPGMEQPRAATTEDILGTIEAFAAAAARCEAAGFAGVELHGAHGYLLAQFLGRRTNTRRDEWGGEPLERRIQLLKQTLEAVRARVSDQFIVGVRISPEILDIGVDFDESLQIASWLPGWGADFVHVSLWDSWMRTARYPDDDTPLTTRYRSVIPAACPLMIAGAVWTAAQAREIRGQGADLVAMARAAIGHPDWPSRARHDPDYSPQRPPFTPEHLARAALSPPFIDYMRRWAGFVTDGRPPRD